MYLQTMSALDLFTKTYGKLQNYGMPFWVMTPFRRTVRGLANIVLPKYLSRPYKQKARVEKDLIVSLTSFPARINNVWQVVECLKRQTVLPEKIILWLSEEQFPNGEGIPESLRKQEDKLFEIRLVEGDIRSHKKYLYAIQEFPEKTFITCDDDVYYETDMIERLENTSLRFPRCIVANNAHTILHDSNGNLLPYLKWSPATHQYESKDLLQVGIGGVLYPPRCLNPLVARIDIFKNVAPLADDIWLNTMARLNKTPIVKAPSNVLKLPVENDSPTLSSINNGSENMNDVQIRQIREYLCENGYDDVYASTYTVEADGLGGGVI